MDAAGSSWPWAKMFWLGTFGCDSASSRRYHRQAFGSLLGLAGAVAIGAAVHKFLEIPIGHWVAGVGTPLVFSYIMWSYYRYVQELDELARRVQLEAVLFSFMFIIVGGIVLSSVWMFTGWTAHPMWVLLAEPVRGVGLIVAARRYR